MNDEMKMSDEKDEFPVGLRVLSVDDNLICLRVLEAKLIQCRYTVTSTTSAVEALNILRRNKNNFDIIVTDVHMPDMDGFKLLECVGLEMDLPCIMLSANDDPKTVMKGIEHGACDYLLKPVRVEELRNIWQHVVRKKKACKEHNNSDNTTSDDGKGGNSNRKPHIKKRKEQNDDEEEGDEETTADNESVSKKKPRIVWTQELHHKFMDAIKILGVNKAVPKKILEMMNVEGLSRENVASHLQKYRLYIKKLEEKANVMATMGLRDQYLNPAARDSYNDFQAFSSSSNHMQALQPYQQNSAFSGNNSNMLLGNNNVARGVVQVPGPPHMNNPINGHGNRFHQGNILQQMPSTSQKRLIIHENNSFDGFQVSTCQTHVNSNISMPLNSNMIHSSGVSNSLPMSSMLSPKVAQGNSNMNHVNFTSGNSSASHPNVSVNNNSLAVDPVLMLNAKNDCSNYLNFGNANQSQNRNISFGSQFGDQPLIDPSSSHGHRLHVGSNKVSMNANGHQNYSNNMPLAQQECRFEKSSPDNSFKNKDDIFLNNPLLQGDLGSSGCFFNELENFIQPEQAFGSPWPSDLKTDPFN